MCATPGPALCRLRAAERRALLPAGTRRAPHGRGASTCGGASAAGVAAARTAGRRRLGGGGGQSKRLRYVKRSGRAQAALPALPAPPRGNRRARGGTRGTSAGVTRAGRAPGRTHPCVGGGTTLSTSPPPPSRGLADIFGDISRRLTAARAGSSAKGEEGIDPPPPCVCVCVWVCGCVVLLMRVEGF